MKKTTLIRTICHFVAAALMIALIGCQFLPFWELEGEKYSIQEYIGYPENYTELTQYFDTLYDGKDSPKFMVKDIVLMPVITLVIGLIGAFFCIWKNKSGWIFLFPLIVGLSGVLGYLTVPAFQLGQMWQLHLVVSILLIPLAIPGIALCFCKTRDFFLSKQD